MKHSEFTIGNHFRFTGKVYRCTDIGSRTVVAICIDGREVTTMSTRDMIPRTRSISRDEAEAAGWFTGPPYAVVEKVFDENDQEICTEL